MSKLDEMRRRGAAAAAESMGVGVTPGPAVHGAPAGGPPPVPARLQGVAKPKDGAIIALDRIIADPDQPREEFEPEALARLADSMKVRGQIQPIRVRWDEAADRYVVVCGERRWRAAALAGLPTMSCVVSDGPIPPGELLAMQLVENLLREDLRPIEQARAYRSLMDRNGWSVIQLARELAIDHSGVSRALALLELPSSVQHQVESGHLSPATAYEVSKLDDPEVQAEVATLAVAGGLSRSEVVEAVRARAGGSATRKGRGSGKGRKVTSRMFRASNGYRFTVESRKGVDEDGIRAALRELLAQLDSQPNEGLREAG